MSATTEPSVCVVIAARNAQATVARAVLTALREPEVAEVVVVDDGSHDRTGEAARAAGGGSPRLRVLRNAQSRGPAAARNLAISCARAPLLCVLDADDYWIEGRLGRLLGSAAGPWDCLADDIVIVPEGTEGRLEAWLRPADPVATLSLDAFVRGNLGARGSQRTELGFLKPVMRRAFLDQAGLREDYALYVEILRRGGIFRRAGSCGYVAVERATSLSGRHGTGDLARLVAFDDGLLARSRGLSPAESAALRAHRAVTWCRWQHRRVLDRRQATGYGAALVAFLSVPRAWPHILDATCRAKLTRLRALYRPRPRTPLGPRLLCGRDPVGMPAK